MRAALAVVVCVVLAGCAQMHEERWANEAAPVCVAYGFPVGTQDHEHCKALVVEEKRRQWESNVAAIATSRPAITCTHYGNISTCR